ncbi:MAG: DUF58 domain-containing protein [Rhodospirillaceae bacterium]
MGDGGLASGIIQTRHRAESLASRLPPLLVAAHRVAASICQGGHGRRRVGRGETFWQFRRYQCGDSAAAIDWRQSAKFQSLFVRETEWAAAQSLWLWCDRSASMDYRSNGVTASKREHAELLVLALAVLLVRSGERVNSLRHGADPGYGRQVLNHLAEVFTAPVPCGERVLNLPPVVPMPRHAQVVMVGDLLSPLDEIQAIVTRMAAKGVRGHLLQVLDPAEETLPFSGRVTFAGLEGEKPLLVPRVESLRAAYRDRLAHHRNGLAALSRTAGWTFASHRTDRPPQTALLALFAALGLEPGKTAFTGAS